MELLRLPITFTGANGASLHAPMIRAVLGGIETLLVLDTGSEVHLLTKELSDVIGLALVDGEEGTDHSGATLPSWSAGDVPMRAGALDLTLRDVVVIPRPGAVSRVGVGGILSPQHLRNGARAALDLADDELLLLGGPDDAVNGWLTARHPELAMLSLQRDGRSSTPVVRGAIAPYPETAMLVNSGGRHTEFDATVVPGLARAAVERLGGGVSGADVMGSVVGPQTLLVGGHALPVGALALRDGMVYPRAMIGMDLLRGTVLSCDSDPGGRVTWQIPLIP